MCGIYLVSELTYSASISDATVQRSGTSIDDGAYGNGIAHSVSLSALRFNMTFLSHSTRDSLFKRTSVAGAIGHKRLGVQSLILEGPFS